MRKLITLLGLLWGACCFAQDTLFVSCSQTVHLRFSSELKYVNLGSRDLIAKIVDGSKDYVAVKAREPFDGCTSMSCLESTGAMHTFVVAYRERPAQLDIDTRIPDGPSKMRPAAPADAASFSSDSFRAIAEQPKALFHLGAKDYGIEVFCDNLLVKDDVLFMVVSLKNGSPVSYALSDPRFAIESVRRTRRGLQYEKAVFPRQTYGLGVVPPGATGRFVFTFDKLTLTRGQVLRVYLYEEGGARNFVVAVGRKDLEGARKL